MKTRWFWIAGLLFALAGALACDGGTGGNDGGPGDGDGGDGDGDGDGDCVDAPAGGGGFDTHVLRFESTGGNVKASLRRVFDTIGVGESAIYTGDTLRVDVGGACAAMFEDDITYENTHHNWNDIATGDTDGDRYSLSMTFFPPTWSYTLETGPVDGAPTATYDNLIVTGGPVLCHACPGYVPVLVSELMTDNESTLDDGTGAYPPWLELSNVGGDNIDLTGWGLSDDPADPMKWTFTGGTIAQGAALVLFAGPDHNDGILPAFDLDGDWIRLTMPDGTSVGERSVDGGAPADQSLQIDLATGAYVVNPAPTPGTLGLD